MSSRSATTHGRRSAHDASPGAGPPADSACISALHSVSMFASSFASLFCAVATALLSCFAALRSPPYPVPDAQEPTLGAPAAVGAVDCGVALVGAAFLFLPPSMNAVTAAKKAFAGTSSIVRRAWSAPLSWFSVGLGPDAADAACAAPVAVEAAAAASTVASVRAALLLTTATASSAVTASVRSSVTGFA